MDIPEEGCIVLLSIEDVQGTRFDSMTCSTGVGKDTYSLDLIWSPSRAGEERIKWTSMNNQPINSKEHPLYGTKMRHLDYTMKSYLQAVISALALKWCKPIRTIW